MLTFQKDALELILIFLYKFPQFKFKAIFELLKSNLWYNAGSEVMIAVFDYSSKKRINIKKDVYC